jgi:hypothetical protein
MVSADGVDTILAAFESERGQALLTRLLAEVLRDHLDLPTLRAAIRKSNLHSKRPRNDQ